MSYSTEHKRLEPVLKLARKLDITENPEPEALFEPGSGGFQIWCTPDDHPKGWEGVPMDMGTFAKPCAFIGSVVWGWTGEEITHLELETEAYDLRTVKQRPPRVRNRPDDITWAKAKIRKLFEKAGVPCPPIRVDGVPFVEAEETPPAEKPVYTKNGVQIEIAEQENPNRVVLTVKFDKPEGKGTLILEECDFGLYVHCPEVSTEGSVAILDLFYGSPAGSEEAGEDKKPPLQIGVFSPAQAEDPLACVNFHPKGTRVTFDMGVTEVKSGKALYQKEFGLEE